MDIEGHEWEIFKQLPFDLLSVENQSYPIVNLDFPNNPNENDYALNW